ncbi:MAG: O-succinylhomoserine sulfhydrylase [Rhodospirillaceae bacterium]|nr:O-succinylhomoserine sulfhydrylase [Rhodospirillaceae bacterium]MBT5459788.1 O-succinylhomoserine sulfhydrylase [Rhodospirillaceae bacterium]
MTIEDKETGWRRKTQLVRGGTRRSQFEETNEAIFMTSGFVYERAEDAEAAFKNEIDRFIYARYGNPTLEMFQDRLCLIEGAESCRVTASGMAAVFASLACQVGAGDRVVGSRALFGSCEFVLTNILPRFGVETTLVDGTDLDQWEKALSKPTKAVFFESPSNPGLEIIDVKAVCDMAHQAGAMVIVDNVFATPVLQHPLELGADIVVYSTTKHIDGQGRTMGGAILAPEEFVNETLSPFYRHTGPSMSPFNAWVLLKGLETLEMRVREHCVNASEIANFLSEQSGLSRVLYPGLSSHPQHALAKQQMSDFGTVVCLDLGGSKDRAFRFMNALNIIDISNNLGDAKSLTTHPATTTHQRISEEERAHLGITDGFVRISVGLEDVEDLKEDISQALAKAG